MGGGDQGATVQTLPHAGGRRSAAERTVPGKDCTWEGSYQPRADCTWNFLMKNFTNPKARHLQVQSARGAGEVSTLSEKTNVRERLGPERTVPGKTVPEFLTSGTVNLFQVQSAQELYLGLQFSLKPEVEVRPGEVQSAHAPIPARDPELPSHTLLRFFEG